MTVYAHEMHSASLRPLWPARLPRIKIFGKGDRLPACLFVSEGRDLPSNHLARTPKHNARHKATVALQSTTPFRQLPSLDPNLTKALAGAFAELGSVPPSSTPSTAAELQRRIPPHFQPLLLPPVLHPAQHITVSINLPLAQIPCLRQILPPIKPALPWLMTFHANIAFLNSSLYQEKFTPFVFPDVFMFQKVSLSEARYLLEVISKLLFHPRNQPN